MPKLQKPRLDQLKPGEVLCDYCTGKCCRYFSVQIETPETLSDFEYIRWYVLHDAATVFVEDDSWYVLVHTVCEKLQDDNRCGGYETRPSICREYTTDNCEYEDHWTYEMYFESAEQIREYCDARFSKPGDVNFRSPPPQLFPVLS